MCVICWMYVIDLEKDKFFLIYFLIRSFDQVQFEGLLMLFVVIFLCYKFVLGICLCVIEIQFLILMVFEVNYYFN